MNNENMVDSIIKLIDDVNGLKDKTNMILIQLKALQKKIKKEDISKKKNIKKPSGFAKKGKISDSLCDFMNVEHGTEKSRPDVTKYLMNYIKEHDLQDKSNKQNILIDDKLKKLLIINPHETITYFNIQKKMNIHFIK
tara:strand:+ start:13308 stop:13721 length:414 start_codon:yes stop_codon:yes gene_type:complete